MSFIEQFRISLGDFRSYRRLSAQPFGRSFAFLVLFLVLIFAVGGIKFSFQYKGFMREAVAQVAAKVPEFTLANGKLTVDGPLPYQYSDDNVIIVIDTGSELGPDVIDAYPQGIYVDADRMVLKQPGATRQLLWTELGDIRLTKADLIGFLESLDWLLIVIGIFYFIWLLISKMLGILVLSLAALIANASLRVGYDYTRLLNISLYSMVVPTLISFGRAMVGVAVPNWWIIHWGVAIAYVVLALKASRDELPVIPPPVA